jgi:hypothetical protein
MSKAFQSVDITTSAASIHSQVPQTQYKSRQHNQKEHQDKSYRLSIATAARKLSVTSGSSATRASNPRHSIRFHRIGHGRAFRCFEHELQRIARSHGLGRGLVPHPVLGASSVGCGQPRYPTLPAQQPPPGCYCRNEQRGQPDKGSEDQKPRTDDDRPVPGTEAPEAGEETDIKRTFHKTRKSSL